MVAWLEYASALGFQARVHLTMSGQMRGTAGDGKEQSGASAVLNSSVVKANRSQVWTERLVSKGVKIVYQESVGTVGSWHGGKAGIVDVGA
ncbi:hypothetical protein D3C74_367960 [compost metagenome]